MRAEAILWRDLWRECVTGSTKTRLVLRQDKIFPIGDGSDVTIPPLWPRNEHEGEVHNRTVRVYGVDVCG
jgi:hypothetical protein